MATTEAAVAAVRRVMSTLKQPGAREPVLKNEDAYSYHTAFSEGGLYLNVATRTSASEPFLALDRKRTHAVLYLHQAWRRVPKSDAPAGAQPAAPVKLAIGEPGGFASGAVEFDVVKTNTIVVFTGPEEDVASRVAFPFPSPEAEQALPGFALMVTQSLVDHEDGSVMEAAASWAGADKPPPSRYADALLQVEPCGRRISPNPSDWVCAVPGCGKTEGLWFNLGTGVLGCGRRNWDGTGGNGHALAHYNETGGAYPLCVKLGTVTAAGGDVYSYAPDEDDGVEDVHLARHLAHWGINVMALSKTDKSMAELELELNAAYDFSRISEAGRDLVAVSGPGRVGLENLGNTCYINSCMQLLSALPEMGGMPAAVGPVSGFGDAALSALLFSTCTGATGIQDDLFAQTAKLMAGLGSATYAASAPVLAGESANATGKAGGQDAVEASIEADNAVAMAVTGALSADAAVLTHTHVAGGAPPTPLPPAPGAACGYLVPRSYRSLVGRGHPDFSTSQQQDIREFMVHLFELYDRAYLSPRAGAVRAALAASGGGALPPNPKDLFSFTLQSRLMCGQSGQVRYVTERAPMLFLRIPAELATNKETVAAARAEAEALALASAPHATGAGPATKKPRLTGPGGTPLPHLHVPFASALSTWAAPSCIEDWTSPATGIRGSATTTQRIAASTLPRVLAVVLARYEQDADWRTVKQDADVPMPLTLDVSAEGIVSTPPPAEEVLLPAAPPAGAAPPPAPVAAPSVEPDGALVSMLVDMGFPAGACSRAAVATANAGAEPAMEWLLVHGEDAGFDAPYTRAALAAAAAAVAVDPAAIATVVDMGFGTGAAAAALAACGGNIERAMDWLFSRAGSGELEGLEGGAAGGAAAPAPAPAAAGAGVTHPDATRLPPGGGRYALIGFLSHMGPSPASGHYVAHVRKDKAGRSPADKGADPTTLSWHIFNDAKVALSEDPPLEQGFVYLYAREA